MRHEGDVSASPIRLHLGWSDLAGRVISRLFWIAGACMAFSIALTAATLASVGGVDAVRELGPLKPLIWGIPALALPWFWQALVTRSAVLELGRDGLSLRVTHLARVLDWRQSTGHITLPWSAIRRARLTATRRWTGRPGKALLVLEGDSNRIVLRPFVWVDRARADHRLSFREAVLPSPGYSPERVMDAPLLWALQARGIRVAGFGPSRPAPSAAGDGDGSAFSRPRAPAARTGPSRDEAGRFRLRSHRGLTVQLGITALLLFVLLVDVLLSRFDALEALPLVPFMLTAVTGLLAVRFLGRGAPDPERWVVGGLTVAALIFAVAPALVWVNALTAGPRVLEYEARAPGVFASPDPAYPDLDLRDLNVPDYWAGYPPGSSHAFTLRRGIGGFAVLDRWPLLAATQRYYRERD